MMAVRAQEMEWDLTVAMMPFSDRRAARGLSRRLAALSRIGFPQDGPPVEILEHDPEKAAAWFREMGVQVVEPPRVSGDTGTEAEVIQ